MAWIYDSKGVKKKVILKTYYNLDGSYMLFDSNPLHNKTFENVGVLVSNKIVSICSMKVRQQVIYITNSNEEPIECEFVGCVEDDDTLIVKLCQDWG